MVDIGRSAAVGLVYLGLDGVEGHCSIGYWLVPRARRQGLGTETVRLASRWVLTETSLYRLDADVEPHNTASLALLRKCGFTSEGVLRSYLRFDDGVFDAVLWSLLSSDL